MKLSKALRAVWWSVLAAGSVLYCVLRFADIQTGKATMLDGVVVVAGLALLLFPLVSEVSFAGLSLKKEVESFKSEVRDQLLSIRTDIHNSIGVQTHVSPSITIGSPADWQLPSIRTEIRETIRQELSALNPQPAAAPEADVSSDVQFLFAVRYSLERELRRLAASRIENNRGYVPVNQLSRMLVSAGLLSLNIERSIREVYSVCSPAIHGANLSHNQIAFVRDVGPELIAALRAIPSENA
jgi:hypothetical protein